MTLLKKITTMALCGALGAVGGAVGGEVLFLLEGAPQKPARSICLLFDVSGSMAETVRQPGREGIVTQLEALQDAARDFVDRQDLTTDTMGLTAFSSDAYIVNKLSHNAGSLKQSIAGLKARGGTNLGRGFDVAREALDAEIGDRWILVFTDGKPETSSTEETPEAAALSAAQRVHEAGINIVAIGTGLADANLLAMATGSSDSVIVSDPHRLADAFKTSEEFINRQMLASSSTSGGFRHNVLMTGIWAALIAIGASTGLVVGQNQHLRRRVLGPREALIVVMGGVFTGVLAGTAGQTAFFALSSVPAVSAIGRVISWSLLGCGIGYGMSFFVPNLRRTQAAAAGAAGGALSSFAFLTLVPAVGDTIGRLLGAGLLGLCTGMTTVLVEAAYRTAWLVVHWSKKERSTLALGTDAIVVGSVNDAHVLIADQDSPSPVMATIRLANGVIQLEDGHAGSTYELHDGDTLTYGSIVIEVCASTGSEVAAPLPRLNTSADEPVRDDSRRQDVPDAVSRARAREGKWFEKPSVRER
jgi:Ca-activated chloride channel family protein